MGLIVGESADKHTHTQVQRESPVCCLLHDMHDVSAVEKKDEWKKE